MTGILTVVSKLKPPPVALELTLTPAKSRVGRYFDTTTVILSRCSLTADTYGGTLLMVRIIALIAPCTYCHNVSWAVA